MALQDITDTARTGMDDTKKTAEEWMAEGRDDLNRAEEWAEQEYETGKKHLAEDL